MPYLETQWPLIAIILVFLVLAVLEVVFPLVLRPARDDTRITVNIALGVLQALSAAALPLAGYAGAETAAADEIGLFHRFAAAWPVQLGIALAASSLAAYWMHRAFHRFAWLWPIHAVHHSDSAVDVSTAFRNHPLELVVVLPVAFTAAAMLGLDPGVAVAASTIATMANFWQHAAFRLPAQVEALLGRVLVTPALHRVHHAPERGRHDSNYGDYLILWDRLFGTFSPVADVPGAVGLPGETPATLELWALLGRPFRPAAAL